MKTVEETVLTSLRQTRSRMIDLKNNPTADEPQMPWREHEEPEPVIDLTEVISNLESQIIDIERQLYRDPEQDAEIRAELYAEMAITGVRDDPSLYMHTPMEEELFQERIAHEVNYGYYDPEDGWVDGIHGDCDYFAGPCSTCNSHTDSDEIHYIDGSDCCPHCAPEAIAFMLLLGFLSGVGIETDRIETEYSFIKEDEYDETMA